MEYAALEDRYMADEDDEAREIAERVRLALDGWNYEGDAAMQRRTSEEPAEFIATSGVELGIDPGSAEALFETGTGRKVRVTVTVLDEVAQARLESPELVAVLEKSLED